MVAPIRQGLFTQQASARGRKNGCGAAYGMSRDVLRPPSRGGRRADPIPIRWLQSVMML